MATLRRTSQRVVAESSGGGASVWQQIIKLSQGPNIVSDCGQGFPDFKGTKLARDTACDIIQNHVRLNQYSPIPGTIRLRKALEAFWNRSVSSDGAKVQADKNIIVTTSGTEAIYSALQAIVDPGDEVIVFEPFFPWYLPAIRMAGGVPITVKLQAPDFKIDFKALESKLTSKTRAIMFNTPHNPTGHVATNSEIENLSKLLIDRNLFCVSDEVYENFIFNSSKHLRIAEVAGLDRTLTIGSASKMFSLTGWRVGWVWGPDDIVSAIGTSHAYSTYSAPTPFQDGSAAALEEMLKPNSDVEAELATLSKQFAKNSLVLAEALETIGVKSIIPDGGYFLVCDVSATKKTDMEFCQWLALEKGVICVPMSVFYISEDAPKNLVRFAICKQPESIEIAAKAIRS